MNTYVRTKKKQWQPLRPMPVHFSYLIFQLQVVCDLTGAPWNLAQFLSKKNNCPLCLHFIFFKSLNLLRPNLLRNLMSTYVYCGERVFLFIFESQINGESRRRRSSEYLVPDESTRLLQVEVLDDITDEVNTINEHTLFYHLIFVPIVFMFFNV